MHLFRRIAWPGLRQVLFQLHWFVGITAGTVLVVIGLSGALLAFREEIVDLITPGGRQVAAAGGPVLPPQQLAQAAQAAHGERTVAAVMVFAEPGRAARVTFAPPPGQRRGEAVYLDPYTGATLPHLAAEPFFEWVESLHRWLLLPREPGRVVTGILAFGLLGLSLSGIYLRWPRNALQWRAWLSFDTTLRGRSFLWSLHAVAGTWALVMYLALTTTGLYWAYDWIRDPVDRAAGVVRPPRQAAARAEPRENAAKGADQALADVSLAWEAFQRRAGESGGWNEASLRMPSAGARTLQITWLAFDAPHERARNGMTLKLPDGEVSREDRYAAKTAAQRALTVIYPLHLGTYFGLPGRIAVLLASLAMPLFAVTGWMLYLDRRRKKRDIARQQAALAGTASPAPADRPPLLLAYASQTGTAEAIALRAAAVLRRAGVAVTLLPFAQLDPERLRHFPRLLLVASSFGDGEAPDSARRAARLLAATAAPSLAHLQYGLLALGDRHYAQFCGFGHMLDHALESAGATRLFPMIEVDDGDARALERWQLALAGLAGVETLAADEPPAGAGFDRWRLQSRRELNPGSIGGPLYRIDLVPAAAGTLMPASAWPPGTLVEIRPRHAAEAVRHLLADAGFDPAAPVRHAGEPMSLADAVSHAAWPAPAVLAGASGPQALADGLSPLATRRYSVASLPVEGRLSLLVRQVRHEGGLGLASGWLTAHAPLPSDVSLRLLDNPAFAPADDDGPAIFIGNGSGYAGLRSHLLQRVAAGRRRNWLLLGERQRAHDAFCADELAQWQAEGFLQHADLVFSRDQPARLYVQDRLLAEADRLRQWVEEGACIYVCGSLRTMAAGVDAALAETLGAEGVDTLIASGRYRRDVY